MIEALMEHPISEDFVRNFIQDFLYKDYDSFINKKNTLITRCSNWY